jgi:hypothetical protein
MAATSPNGVSVKALMDPARFTKVPGCVVFDEHDEYNEKHELVEKFDKARLEKMAARNNKRALTGQLTPLSIGHTIDDEVDDEGKVTYKAKEEDQPELVGYAHNFRVKFSKRLNKYVIKADFYVRNDRLQHAATFPRVSIERWKDGVIDPVALLRRTPARDLPHWSYLKLQAASVQGVYGGDGADLMGRVWQYAKHGKNQVVRYAMAEEIEGRPPDAPPPGGHDEPPFDEHGEDEDEDEDRDAPPPADDEGDDDDDDEDDEVPPTAPVGAEHGDEDEDEDDEGGEGPPRKYGRFMKHMKYWMANEPEGRHFAKHFTEHGGGGGPEQYQAGAAAGAAAGANPSGPGFPGPNTPYLPGWGRHPQADDRPEARSMKKNKKVNNARPRESLADQMSRQRGTLTVEQRLAAMEARQDELVERYQKEKNRADRSEAARLADLHCQEYPLEAADKADLIERLAPLSDKKRAQVLAHYRRLQKDSRDPTSGDLIRLGRGVVPGAPGSGSPENRYSKEQVKRAVRLCTERGITDKVGYAKVLAEVAGETNGDGE